MATDHIPAELTAAAVDAGMRDPSDLTHVDVSAVDINGVTAFIEGLRATKPHWFNATPDVRNISAAEYRAAKAAIVRRQPTAPAPPAADAPHARDMTEAEYRAARARVTGRR